jgi:hypothetical protein
MIPYSTVINGAPKRAGFKNSINSTIFFLKEGIQSFSLRNDEARFAAGSST